MINRFNKPTSRHPYIFITIQLVELLPSQEGQYLFKAVQELLLELRKAQTKTHNHFQ